MYILTESGRKKSAEYLKRLESQRRLCLEKALDTADNVPDITYESVIDFLDKNYQFGDKTGQISLNIKIADDTKNLDKAVLVYGEDFIIGAEKTFVTDKKLNAAYWDEIDATIERFLKEIASFSTKPFEFDGYDDGFIPDVREMVISSFKARGGDYPYVDCCM